MESSPYRHSWRSEAETRNLVIESYRRPFIQNQNDVQNASATIHEIPDIFSASSENSEMTVRGKQLPPESLKKELTS